MRLTAILFTVLCLALMPFSVSAEKGKKDEKKLTPATVKNMGVTKDGDVELFCMDFSNPRVPDLQTIDDEANPRVFFDIPAIAEWKGQSTYEIKGSLIKQVRTGYNGKDKKLRVVIDLAPVYNYNVEPSFDDRYNLFCVAFSARSVR